MRAPRGLALFAAGFVSAASVSGYENYRYADCRFDRIDKKLAELGAVTPSPSVTPSAPNGNTWSGNRYADGGVINRPEE